MSNNVAKKVYYDGSCPLCKREIGFYRKQKGSEKVSWIDLSLSQNIEVEPGLTKSSALKRFHVKLENGSIVSGASAFISLWLSLDRFTKFGKYLNRTWIIKLLDILYNWFLFLRPSVKYINNLISKEDTKNSSTTNT